MSLVQLKRPSLPPSAGTNPSGGVASKIKKGEILFAEGESSRAMYFIKSGMIRIFKRKGSSNIELDTIHSGQIVGELAFLDGQPRSASAETLTECQLVEISGHAFNQTLARMPEWLKILLKTVVSRLRGASNRIRQLETASTAYRYDERDGKRSSHYVFLSPSEVLKSLAAVLLVASRHGETVPKGTQVRVGMLQRYGNQIMQVPVAKITTLLDVLTQAGAVWIDPEKGMSEIVVTDLEFIEKAVTYLNEQNLLEPSKRSDISLKGFVIMSYIAKHMARFPRDDVAGTTTVNLAEIKKLQTSDSGKEPFRMDDFSELIQFGYAGTLEVKSNDEILTTMKTESFLLSYRLQRFVKTIEAANEQKST